LIKGSWTAKEKFDVAQRLFCNAELARYLRGVLAFHFDLPNRFLREFDRVALFRNLAHLFPSGCRFKLLPLVSDTRMTRRAQGRRRSNIRIAGDDGGDRLRIGAA
jgi:hypothetical protein